MYYSHKFLIVDDLVKLFEILGLALFVTLGHKNLGTLVLMLVFLSLKIIGTDDY